MTPAEWAAHAEQVREHEVKTWRAAVTATGARLKAKHRALESRWRYTISGVPRAPHSALRALARDIWSRAWPTTPWPHLSLFWGRVEAPRDLPDAKSAGIHTPAALIVIDERHAPEYAGGVPAVVLHELTHFFHLGHGPAFQRELAAAQARLNTRRTGMDEYRLKCGHAARVEIADASGRNATVTESFLAIKQTIERLERRGVDVNKVRAWTTKRLKDGSLIGVPAKMRVDEALAITKRRKRRI